MHHKSLVDSRALDVASDRGHVLWRWPNAWLVCVTVFAIGCSWHPSLYHLPGESLTEPMSQPLLANPLLIPVANRELVWSQLVDTIDNYFVVAREERVRTIGAQQTPGWIETKPIMGSTYLEPWRRDSTPGFERLHSTLQTIRRKAHVDVSPTGQGYLVQVIVTKELEDVDRPEHTTVGAATKRHDGSLVRIAAPPVSGAVHRGWLPQGRDIALEQRILWELRDRLRNDGWPDEVMPPPAASGWFEKDRPH